ncbi:MAG: hypothetical protein FWE20_08030 [Defluviitaleaceae bacterium]|nr:hypothetical protein [Defluviitaleaceae bacterium]
MIIEYALTKKEYLGLYFFYKKHLKDRQNPFDLGVRTPLAVILFVYLVVITPHGSIISLIISAIIPTLAVLSISLTIMHSVMRQKYSIEPRFVSKGKNADNAGQFKLILKGENMETSMTPYISYRSIEMIGYGYDCIFIFLENNMDEIVVPVTAFSDDLQMNRFIQTLKEKTRLDPVGGLRTCIQ